MFGQLLRSSFLEFEGREGVGWSFAPCRILQLLRVADGNARGTQGGRAGMAKIKSHADRGMYYPYAGGGDESSFQRASRFHGRAERRLRERRDVVVKGLGEGLDSRWTLPRRPSMSGRPSPRVTPLATFVQGPRYHNVWMIPGSVYGKYREGYLRIALTHPAERLSEAMGRLKKMLS